MKDAKIDFMDKILMCYKYGFKPDRESAFKMYDYLKSMGVMKIPKEVIEEIRVKAGNNNDAAKLHALKYFLDRMLQNGLTFKMYK